MQEEVGKGGGVRGEGGGAKVNYLYGLGYLRSPLQEWGHLNINWETKKDKQKKGPVVGDLGGGPYPLIRTN